MTFGYQPNAVYGAPVGYGNPCCNGCRTGGIAGYLAIILVVFLLLIICCSWGGFGGNRLYTGM